MSKKEYKCSVEWVQTYRVGHSTKIKAYSKEEAEKLFKKNFEKHYNSNVDFFDKFSILDEESSNEVYCMEEIEREKKTIEEKLKEINKDNLFRVNQMEEIRRGLQENLDVSIYAKPEFNFAQMQEIRFGLEDNLDISIYAKPEFGWEQMWKIRVGLEEKEEK